MARKSRKRINDNETENIQPITEQAERIRTAAYARISIDKGDDTRDSIETQTVMIQQYIEDHPEFELTDVYQDVGYS